MFVRTSCLRGSVVGSSRSRGPFPRARKLALEPLEDRRLLAAGDLDVSFDSDGLVTTDLGGYDYAWSVAVQDDGGVEKIVVAGTSGGDFALARYLPDGALDTSFGTSGTGIVTTDFGSDSDYGSDVTVDPSGKIVMAGSTKASASNSVFAVARYNADGSLDTSFDGDGMVTADFGGQYDGGQGVAISPDGKIVVAGAAADVVGSSFVSDFALARYNADGSLDSTFDGDGKLTTTFAFGHSSAKDVAVDPSGKIVAVGSTFGGGSGYFATARYNTDGSLDTSFDSDGKTTSGFGVLGVQNQSAEAVAIQSDGKIVVAGHANIGPTMDFALIRYEVDGTPNGQFIRDFGNDANLGGMVVVDPAGGDDSIVMAGEINVVPGGQEPLGHRDFVLVRLTANCTPDPSFGTGGVITTDFGSAGTTFDYGTCVAVQSDGKIVVAGRSGPDYSSATDFALARYLSSEPIVDDDDDGIETAEEDGVDGDGDGTPDGDGNQDGTLDSEQTRVASFENAADGQYVTMVLTEPSAAVAPDARLVGVQALDPAGFGLPTVLSLPIGVVDFEVEGVPPGSAVEIEILVHSDVEEDSHYVKYGSERMNPQPHWYDFTDYDDIVGAEIDAANDRITLRLVDGDPSGDDDQIADGKLADAWALARPPVWWLGTIYGTVFNDANGNAQYDSATSGSGVSNEQPMGQSVRVWIDRNGNGTYDTFEPETWSDSSTGEYGFGNLSWRTHIVRQDTPSGWVQTYPPRYVPQVFSDQYMDGPTTVVVDYLNGDAYPDVAAGNLGTPSGVMVYWGESAGSFSEMEIFPTEIGWLRKIASGNVDRAGAQDLVALGDSKISVLLADHGGFITLPIYLGPDFLVRHLGVGDIDGQNGGDVIFGGPRGRWVDYGGGPEVEKSALYAVLQNPDGTFPSSPTEAEFKKILPTNLDPQNLFYIASDPLVADLDGDGDQDIAVAATLNTHTREMAVLSNDGTGEFTLVGMFPCGGDPVAVTAHDMDDDGDLDLVTGNAGSTVSILYNTCAADGSFDQPGGGTFGTAVSYNTGVGPRDVLVADMDADGLLDIVVAAFDADPGTLAVVTGLDDGTFGRPYGIPAGDTPRAIDAVDTNGDDVPDVLAVANHWPDTVTVLTPNPAQAHLVDCWLGRTVDKVDFGNQLLGGGAIGGRVFHDLDGNGSYDLATETALENWVVFLDLNGDRQVDELNEPWTRTDSFGSYTFNGLASGSYAVGVHVLEGGWGQTAPGGGALRPVGVSAGGIYQGNDFAFRGLPTIRGTVWNDDDADGVRDDETPLVDWRVYLDLDGNGARNTAGEPMVWTDTGGGYEFVNAPLGDYSIRALPEADWVLTTSQAALPVQAGYDVVIEGEDFGYHAPHGRISGFVWDDANGNGQMDGGESGMGGVTVYLDQNQNRRHDTGEPSTLTETATLTAGAYSFGDLLSGVTYTVAMDCELGRWQSSPAVGGGSQLVHTVALLPRDDVQDKDFGNAPGGGEIHGTKWIDGNRDYAYNSGEGVEGVTVFVDLDRDSLLGPDEPYCVTDADGGYLLDGLPAGEHRVTELDPGRELFKPDYLTTFWTEPRTAGYSLSALDGQLLVGDPGVIYTRSWRTGNGWAAGSSSQADIGIAFRVDAATGDLLATKWNSVRERDANLDYVKRHWNSGMEEPTDSEFDDYLEWLDRSLDRYAGRYGASVLLAGSREWLGAPRDMHGEFEPAYRSRVVEASGGLLTHAHYLADAEDEEMGTSLAGPLSILGQGDFILAGAPGNGGRVRFLAVDSDAQLPPLENPAPSAGSEFGAAVAVLGDSFLVGDPGSGTVYLYEPNNSQPIVIGAPVGSSRFGASLAVSGSKILVGAPGGNGAAYLLDVTDLNSPLEIPNPTPAANDKFGHSVVFVGDKLIVGAPFDDTYGTSSGAVYVFGGNGTLQETLHQPRPNSVASFGYSLAVLGEALYVGAPSLGSNDAGAVYDFLVRSPVNLASGESVEFNLTSPIPAVDRDADGVDGREENGVPNNGDGNNDGVADAIQANVTSLTDLNGEYLTLEVLDRGTDQLKANARLVNVDVRAVPNSAPAEANLGVGFFSFMVDNVGSSDYADVRITLHSGQEPTSYYKFGLTPASFFTPHWYEFDYVGMTGARFDGNVITLHLGDGYRGDGDLGNNGRIVDPGGPSFAENTPPIIQTEQLSVTSAEEGSPATLSCTFSDLDVDDGHAVRIDWGDGQIDEFALHIGERTFSADHVYEDDDPTGTPSDFYTVEVTIDDGWNPADTAETTVEITTANAIVDAGGDRVIDIGDMVELAPATFTDAGTLDTHTATIDWGDGSAVEAGLVDAEAGTVSGNHVYTSGGTYTVTVSVIDDDTGVGQDTFAVSVVQPLGTIEFVELPELAPLAGDLWYRFETAHSGYLTLEAPSRGLFGDLQITLYDASRGELETSTLVAGLLRIDRQTVAGVTYFAKVSGLADNVMLTINNLPPSADAGGPYVVDEGQELQLDATGSAGAGGGNLTYAWDLDDDGEYDDAVGATAMVSWATLVALGLPSDGTTLTVGVEIDNQVGGSDTDDTTLAIDNVAPQLADLAASATVEGGVSTLTGTIADPGTLDSFVLSVDWGDGSPIEQFDYPAGTTGFGETHRYLDDDEDDAYTIMLTLGDSDGGGDAETVAVGVTNVPPTIAVEGLDEVTAFTEYTLTLGAITDPGEDTVTKWEVDWGDGSHGIYSSGGEKTHSFEPGTHTISITLTDEDGRHTGAGGLEVRSLLVPVEVTDLGQVDFTRVEHVGVYPEDSFYYQVEAMHDGFLSFETVPHLLGHGAPLGLYDMKPLGMPFPYEEPILTSSLNEDGNHRIDWPVTAGQTYFVRAQQAVADFDLVVVNLVHHENTSLTVHGTAGDDDFGFGPTASIEVIINGVGYVFDEAQVAMVSFDGTAGYDTADLSSMTADSDDSAEVWHNRGTFTSGGVTCALFAVESIDIDGRGGEDTVVLHDSPGDDEVYARAVTSYQPVTSITMADFDFGDPNYVSTYSHALVNFEVLTAHSTAGIDVASFYDSDGDDEFIGRQHEATLSGDGFNFRAEDFAIAHGYAKADGDDRAELYDTPRNDRFKASPVYARMFKGIYQRRVKFYETVVAYADSGGGADHDDARLFDSASPDQFTGMPTESRLYSDEAGYDIRVVSFDAVLARAGNGYDVATFIGGAGNDLLLHKWLRADTLVESPKTEMMDYETKGEVYKITARRFSRATAQGGQEGFDIAKFWDTLEADRFTADGDTAGMYDPADELLYDAIAFDKVLFNHVFGGNDRTEKAAVVNFLLSEYWAP